MQFGLGVHRFGDQKTVVNWDQTIAYVHCLRLPWQLSPSYLTFHFEDDYAKSEGILGACIPIPGQGSMIIDRHVVRAGVLMLLGLDVLRSFRLTFDFHPHGLQSPDPP